MEYSVINEAASQTGSNSRVISLILSDNGSVSEYPMIKFVSPIGLKRASFLMDFVENQLGISKGNQLILRSDDGKQLEPNMNLEEFFKKDTTIYLYVIKGQSQENAQDDFEIIGGMTLEKRWSESITQFIPSFYENQLGANVKDFLESNVAGYYNELMSIFSDIKNELNVIKEGSIKLQRQKQAQEVAKKNLSNYYTEKKKKFDETINERETKIALIQQYIDNFDSSLAKLAKQTIDPQLGEEEKKHLIDYFDTEKLKTYRNNYEKNQIKIKQKAQEIKNEIVEYETQLQNIEGGVVDNSIEVQNALRDQENLYVDIQDTNIQGFKQLIEEKKGNPTQKDLSDFVKKEYEISYPKLKAISQDLVAIRDRLEDQLKANAVKLKDLVSDILNLRVIVKGKIYNKLKVFHSLVEKHAEQIFNLEIIEKFPMVYEQSLNEIKRRMLFKRDYMTILNVLEYFANSENKMRNEFLDVYQQYLPKTFCPFLSKTFPQLHFDSIRRMINEDVGFELGDFDASLNQNPKEDFIKLLDNNRKALEDRDTKNKELENTLQDLQDENEKLKEQMKQRVFSVTNLRKLLGATGFQDKVDDFLESYQKKLSERMEQVEKRVKDIQEEKISSVTQILNQYKEKLQVGNETALQLNKDRVQTIENLEQENVAQKNTIKRLEEVTLELQSELEVQRKELVALMEEKETIVIKLENLSGHQKELTQEKEALQKELLNSSIDTTALQQKEAKIQELEGKLKTITQEKETIAAQVQEKNKTIESMKTLLHETKERLNTATDDCEKIKAEKDKKIVFLNGQIKQSQAKTEVLEKEKAEISRRMIEVQEKLNARIKAAEVTEQKLEESAKTIKRLQETMNQQQNNSSSSHEEVAQLINELEKANDLVKTKEMIINELTEELNAQKVQLAKLGNSEEVTKLRAEFEKLNATLKSKEDMIKNTSNVLEEKLCENEELRNIIKSLQSEEERETLFKITGDLGTKIIHIFSYLFGSDHPKLQKEFDVQEALDHILEFINTKMVKIDDFRQDDKALAVKINDEESNYLVLKRDIIHDFSVAYVYKAEKYEGDLVMGEIIELSQELDQGHQALAQKLKCDAVVSVKMRGVHAITPLSVLKPKA